MIPKKILLLVMLYITTIRSQEMKDMMPNEYMRFLRMLGMAMNNNASNERMPFPPYFMPPMMDSNFFDQDYIPFTQYDTKRMTMGFPFRPGYVMPPMDDSELDFPPFRPPLNTSFSNNNDFMGFPWNMMPSDSDKNQFPNMTNHFNDSFPDDNEMPLFPLPPFWPYFMPPMWHKPNSDDFKPYFTPFMPDNDWFKWHSVNSSNNHHLTPPDVNKELDNPKNDMGKSETDIDKMEPFPIDPFWSISRNQFRKNYIPHMPDSDSYVPFKPDINHRHAMDCPCNYRKIPSSFNGGPDPVYDMDRPITGINMRPPMKPLIPIDTYNKNTIPSNIDNYEKNKNGKEFLTFLTDYQNWLKRNDDVNRNDKREISYSEIGNHDYNLESGRYPSSINNYYDKNYDEPKDDDSRFPSYTNSYVQRSDDSFLYPLLFKPYKQSLSQRNVHQKDMLGMTDYRGQYLKPPFDREQKHLVNVQNYNPN